MNRSTLTCSRELISHYVEASSVLKIVNFNEYQLNGIIRKSRFKRGTR